MIVEKAAILDEKNCLEDERKEMEECLKNDRKSIEEARKSFDELVESIRQEAELKEKQLKDRLAAVEPEHSLEEVAEIKRKMLFKFDEAKKKLKEKKENLIAEELRLHALAESLNNRKESPKSCSDVAATQGADNNAVEFELLKKSFADAVEKLSVTKVRISIHLAVYDA